MLSNEQQGGMCAARISFSNDFADSQHPGTMRQLQQDFRYKEAPVSSDNFEFDFSVSGYNMISADQLFCKGKLMPLKDDRSCCSSKAIATTLQDELLQGNDDDDDDYGDLFPRMPKGMIMSRWRERLGLKRSHFFTAAARKPTHNNLQRIDETNQQ